MKKFLIILLFLPIIGFGQQWEQFYGGNSYDSGSSVKETLDLGFIITGSTESFSNVSSNLYLIKTDSLGDTLWTKTVGENIHNEYGIEVIETNDSSYVVFGFEHNGNGKTAILIKFNQLGDTVWHHSYYSEEDTKQEFLEKTTDNGFIFGGGYNEDGILIKTNSIGTVEWTLNLAYGEESTVTSVKEINNGYIILEEVEGILGQDVPRIVKVSSNGEIIWEQIFEEFINVCEEIQQTTDQGYLIVGGNSLLKIDSLGGFEWGQPISDNNFNFRDLSRTNDGGFVLLGYNNLIKKIDELGAQQWSIELNASGSLYSIQQTTDLSYVLLGNSYSGENTDVYMVKIDSIGSIMSWNCEGFSCIDPGDGSGFYSSLVDCESLCIKLPSESWDCISDICTDPGDGSGIHSTLLDCQNTCVLDTWSCELGACVEVSDGSGFLTIEECELFCTPLSSWDCVGGSCIDPTDGSGFYSNLADCETECITSSITGLNKANKKLKKITDLLGQEIPIRKNTPMFYFYDDSSVEKRIILE